MPGFDIEPSPQTTLVILLGASAWPLSSLGSSPAFAKSAVKVKDYFCDPGKFGLPPENWLDLFDQRQDSPSEVYQAISTFLEERLSQMHQTGKPARDLFFYYIGHGIFASGYDQTYHLAIRTTQNEVLRSSAIAMAALAEMLKVKAKELRRIVTLDCCFAAESFRYMQSPPDQLAIKQAVASFAEKSKARGLPYPRKGTALLCSSSNKEASFILQDGSGTMFSEALVRALTLGNKRQPSKTHFTLHDIKLSIEDVLEDFADRYKAKPEVHSPDTHDGDVATIPFFPNPWAESKKVDLAIHIIYQPRSAPPSSVASSAQSPLALPESSLFCPRCGYQNRPGAKFCRLDGQALTLTASPTSYPQPVGTTEKPQVAAIATVFEYGVKTDQLLSPPPLLSTDDARNLIDQGISLIGQSKFKDALALFEEIAKIYPDFCEGWLGKGICSQSLGRFEEAVVAYEQAIQRGLQRSMVWRWKGDAYRSLQQYPEALSAYEEALTLDRNDSALWNSKGDTHADLKMYEEALLAYEQALVLNPNFVQALYNKGAILVVQGKADEALATFDKAISIAPSDVTLWYGKGLIYELIGEPNEALSAFDKVLAIDSQYRLALEKKVELLIALKRHFEAIKVINRLLFIDPQDASAWYEKGKALISLNKAEAAIDAFGHSLAIDANQTGVWYAKGLILYIRQNYPDALIAFNQLLALKPDYVHETPDGKPNLDQYNVGANLKGFTLFFLGQFEEANSAFDDAIKILPEHYYSWRGKMDALRALGFHEEALKAEERAQKIAQASKEQEIG